MNITAMTGTNIYLNFIFYIAQAFSKNNPQIDIATKYDNGIN